MAASTETRLPDGGFRRVTPAAPPGAVARLQQQLLAVTSGRPEHVQRGLRAVQRWGNLALLCSGPWFADVLRAPDRARWTLERRLTLLGQEATTIAAALQAPSGTAVKLVGIARCLGASGTRSATPRIGNVWKNSTQRALEVREVEEGHDFLLMAAGGEVRVLGQGGHLLHGDRVDDGASVQVLGFVDRVVDPAGVADGGRGAVLSPVIRSGDELPLLLWRV